MTDSWDGDVFFDASSSQSTIATFVLCPSCKYNDA